MTSIKNLVDMQVCRQHHLRYPGHVLPGPDVDLGHAIRRILVQDHCEGAGVHTAAHVLLVRSLKCNIPILNLLYLLPRTLWGHFDHI